MRAQAGARVQAVAAATSATEAEAFRVAVAQVVLANAGMDEAGREEKILSKKQWPVLIGGIVIYFISHIGVLRVPPIRAKCLRRHHNQMRRG